jgi:Domain of Unknown Function with PDB structure (DUF3862)
MIYLGLWLLVLGVSVVQAASIHQETTADCSPTVGQTQGNLTMYINCPRIDPKALDALNRDLGLTKGELRLTKGELRLTKQQLEQKTKEANEWARKYHELSRQAEASQDKTLARETKALLREGKLEEADTLLRRSAISMAQYHAIQTGMSYPEVVRVLGRPGVEYGSSAHGSGPNIVQYIWQNANGSFVMLVFVNDQVHQKVQRLLR